MTHFVRIDPTARKVEAVEAEDWAAAARTLKPAHVDFGAVTPDITIIVYEYGLMEGNGPYFALGGQLYSGEAILYAADQYGETIDMPGIPLEPIWLADKAQVELAIATGIVARPQTLVNGAVMWQWS